MGKNLKSKVYYTSKQYNNFSKIYFAIGILFFLSALLFLSTGFTFTAIICILVSVFLFSKSKQFKKNSIEDSIENSVENSFENSFENSVSKIEQEKNMHPSVFTNEVQHENQIAQKFENHNVAGTSYRQNEILSLISENDDYDLKKNELIDLFDLSDGECEKIYKYEIEDFDAILQEEPENEYDKNAIKVVISGIHVGYIKKGSCSHIKKLIANGNIQRITARIYGGDYKMITCDYDFDKDKDVYTLEKDKTGLNIKLTISVK